MKHKTICIPKGTPAARVLLGAVADAAGLRLVEYDVAHGPPGDELFAQSPALLVVTTSVKLDSTFLDRADGRVGALASVSTGDDHVHRTALDARGVPFFHAPGANSESVVEYVLCALPFVFPVERLLSASIRVGIVGYGRIGSRLGIILSRLGIPHTWFDPFVDGRDSSGVRAGTISEPFECDLVTLHLPLSTGGSHPTLGLMDEDLVRHLRRDSVLVNTARGRVFTEAGYRSACARARTIMDVFLREPPAAEAVRAAKFVSPHVAGYNYTARANGTRMVAVQFARRLGLSADIVPDVPRLDCPISIVNCLPLETGLLRDCPDSFAERRSAYPSRAGIADAPPDSRSEFHERILEVAA